jgi:hypothetical protein
MAKPMAVRDAMARHPDRVVIFLDVDCEVRGDLSPLAEMVADVAFYVRSRRGSKRHSLRDTVRDHRGQADAGSARVRQRMGDAERGGHGGRC